MILDSKHRRVRKCTLRFVFCYFMAFSLSNCSLLVTVHRWEFSELKIPYDTVRDDLHESEMMIQS